MRIVQSTLASVGAYGDRPAITVQHERQEKSALAGLTDWVSGSFLQRKRESALMRGAEAWPWQGSTVSNGNCKEAQESMERTFPVNRACVTGLRLCSHSPGC